MRREGYELSVGKPQVILHEQDGVNEEPFESLVVEVPPGPHGPGDGAGRRPPRSARGDDARTTTTTTWSSRSRPGD